MKTLHAYLTRQIVASLVMTVLVFTFVILLANGLKEILPFLVSGKVKFNVVTQAVGFLIPWVWVFALPMGMLTATLLTFGRFSADQELTAARAGGVSLLALVSPILLLSLFLCGVSALINMEIGPRCRVAYTTLFARIKAELTSILLPERQYIKEFPGYIFYVGKNDHKGDLYDILIFHLENGTNETWTMRAPRGKMEVDNAQKLLTLRLYDAKTIALDGREQQIGAADVVKIDVPLENAQGGRPQRKIDDMTFMQLWAEMHDLEQRLNMPISLKGMKPEQIQARKRVWEQQRKDLTPVIFQIHRQVAFSFACFGYTLLGIPLGIRVHRRETNIGIAMALLLVAVYYSFILVGQALDTKPEYLPYLIVWAPNILFQSLGTWLLWRANRGV
jgi:lipopolysaccharide export system permease protein